MPTVKCTIRWDDAIQAYAISTPFNPNFVSAIKALIPASDRAWDERSMVWTFTEPYLAAMTTLAKQLWPAPGEVVVVNKQQSQKRVTAPMAMQGTATCALEFLRILGFDAVQKAYRTAALECHPDKVKDGGDRMAQVNSMWDRIKKEVFNK